MDAQTRALHVGAGSQGGLNKVGQHVCSVDRPSAARGCREKGAGRKDYYVAYKIMLKEWVQEERDNGHSLDMSDLVLQWFFYAEEIKKRVAGKGEGPAARRQDCPVPGPPPGVPRFFCWCHFLIFFGTLEPFGGQIRNPREKLHNPDQKSSKLELSGPISWPFSDPGYNGKGELYHCSRGAGWLQWAWS